MPNNIDLVLIHIHAVFLLILLLSCINLMADGVDSDILYIYANEKTDPEEQVLIHPDDNYTGGFVWALNGGITRLMRSTSAEDTEFWLKYVTNINDQDSYGRTALMLQSF